MMKVEEISVASCVPLSGNPFKVRDDFDMELLVQSVLDYGVMFPIMVRPLDGGKYEIVSGHRRVHACEKAGIDKIPAFIKSMSRDEAVIMMVDSNLQRESLLPSEKAFAYKLKMDALKRQGKRTDLTSDRVGPKLTATEMPYSLMGSPCGSTRVSLRDCLSTTTNGAFSAWSRYFAKRLWAPAFRAGSKASIIRRIFFMMGQR